jgi:hypothetical protein
MKKNKVAEKDKIAAVNAELDELLKKVKSRKSALQKMAEIRNKVKFIVQPKP